MLSTTLALAAPFLFTGAAVASSFPEIVIRKAETQHEWAFSIDEGTLTCVPLGARGTLTCVPLGARRFVFFGKILTPEEMGEIGNMKLPRSVMVTTNPLELLAGIEDRELYAPWDSLETLVMRLAPFREMGEKLCDGQKEL